MHRLLRLGLLGALFVVVGCSAFENEHQSASRENIDLSTADVLVPLDERFRKTFDFAADTSPDNYGFSTNSSVSFDPDNILELRTLGVLVNDENSWLSGVPPGGGGVPESQVDPFRAALEDSAPPLNSSACAIAVAEPEIVVCEYPLASSGFGAAFAIRRFEDVGTVMIAAGVDAASITLLMGEFEAVPIKEAAERWS